MNVCPFYTFCSFAHVVLLAIAAADTAYGAVQSEFQFSQKFGISQGKHVYMLYAPFYLLHSAFIIIVITLHFSEVARKKPKLFYLACFVHSIAGNVYVCARIHVNFFSSNFNSNSRKFSACNTINSWMPSNMLFNAISLLPRSLSSHECWAAFYVKLKKFQNYVWKTLVISD